MADATNNAVILSAVATQALVGSDVQSIGFYDAATGGNLLGGSDITNNPSALVLGERYQHAIGAFVLRQPVTVGAVITAVDGAASTGATTIVVDAVTNISAGQHIAINGRAYEVSSIATTTRTLTLGSALVFDVADDAEVRIALETEEAAQRKLRGYISGGIHIAYFSSVWADTHSGTENLIALARTAITQAQFTIS